MSVPTKIATWLASPLSEEVARALERLARAESVERIAVMPDVHLAQQVCIGTVVATRNLLYPEAVGGDIGCGVATGRFEGDSAAIRAPSLAARLLAELGRAVPTAQHPSADAELTTSLSKRPLSAASLERVKKRIGRVQLGTLGRGNHFLELQSDDENRLWLMVHSGSRGLGQAIRDHHLSSSRLVAGGLRALDPDTDDGKAYLADVGWALDYAATSRQFMFGAVEDILRRLIGAEPVRESYVDCHHNFVRCEQINGAALWIHRKGAISARDGEPGIIPGSMGSESFHVTGRGCATALYSSSHGAGRKWSRSEARRRISTRNLERQMQGIWFDPRLLGRLRDEAPAAYKNIGAVMKAQSELTRVERRVVPLLSYKGV